MNYLQLVNRLKRECGVSGSDPSTLTSQPAEINRLASFITTAWIELQTLHPDWFFLRQPFSFNTVAQQQSYSATQAGISLLGSYKRDSVRVYLQTAANEMLMPFMPYDRFRDLYMLGNMRTNYARPVVWTQDPQKQFLLGSIPDTVYVVNGEYYLQPTDLAADTDTPTMPSQFHMALVYRAMMDYGTYEGAGELRQDGEIRYRQMLAKLQLDQLPTLTFGVSLA